MKKTLTDLAAIAPEMLGGLRAGAAMRARILEARRPVSMPMWPRLAAVGCAAALALAVGVTALVSAPPNPDGTVPIEMHAAGDELPPTEAPILIADVPWGSLTVGGGSSGFPSRFFGDAGNFPLIGYDGGAYRMLRQPITVSRDALGSSLGSAQYVSDPSQAASDAWFGLISNAVGDDTPVYAISGLSNRTAVAAEVDGQFRLFQRYSYGNYGPGSTSLESALDVRGKVRSLELSGVGKITDSGVANALINTLLDNAVHKSNAVARSSEALTIELQSGLVLQLLVSQSTFSACGAWSCPEFVEAFEAALE